MWKSCKNVKIIIFIAILVALAFFALQGYHLDRDSNEIIGKNTFVQTMVQADGSEVSFFASGDQYFNYLHDEEGHLLLRDDGYLVYAKSNNKGRPVPTQVRYTDPKDKVYSLQKMTYSDIDFSQNSDLLTDYPQSLQSSTSSRGQFSEVREIVNITIYISFKGENVSLDRQQIDTYLNGPENSLVDYYNKISYGKIILHNIHPIQENNQIFIYEDSQPRSYYQLRKGAATRAIKEKTLLNNAINACKQYIDLTNLNISTLEQGYVDAVNFLVSGSPYSEWGGMLWPHSWDLNDISNNNPATIGGFKVRKYSFNFLEQLTVGLLAHEFAHVLGVPDLYHYNDSYAAVGNWDLMHFEADIPQYMLTHLREKYLGVIPKQQIVPLKYNGVYSLSPTAQATEQDILAYKIETDMTESNGEYFMLEYRNNNVSSYDASLPGSGLLIYRVKEGIYGNADARKERVGFPDEVFIFRPDVVTAGSDQTTSVANLNKAYLSPNNPDFMSIGMSKEQLPNANYDKSTIYYANGENSGISIEALFINENEITFEVHLSGSNNVDDDYFKEKVSLEDVKLNNDENFSGVAAKLTFVEEINLSYLANVVITLRGNDNKEIASIDMNRQLFRNKYNNGTINFDVEFIVNNKGNTDNNTVFYPCHWNSLDEPYIMEMHVVDSDNDYILISTREIDKSQVSWHSIERTNIAYHASVEASHFTNIAVRTDGRAFVASSKSEFNGRELEDIIFISSSDKTILYVTSSLRVYEKKITESGLEEREYQWPNIIKAIAHEEASYGLDLKGKVYAEGKFENVVQDWDNIIDIAANTNVLVSLKNDGTIRLAGNSSYQEGVNNWQNIIAITCGESFIAGLGSDGKVRIVGSLNNSATVNTWKDIVMIDASDDHLLALDKSGRVFAAGNNNNNQCNVGSQYNIYDIIDIAAGTNYSMLLREDGQIIYKGESDTLKTNTENLIYYEDNYVPASFIVSPFESKIIKVGEKYQFNLSVMPHNATYKQITYRSNDETKVRITPDGLMTGLQEGNATITAIHRGCLDIKVQFEITVIIPIETQAMIATGDKHTVLLNNEGTVMALGENSHGQLDVEMWGNIKYIAAGGNTTVGITADGEVRVAGEMKGMGAEDWTDIVYVDTSGSTLVGIRSSGIVNAIGNNDFGQIERLNNLSNVKKVILSPTHSIELYADGTVFGSGHNGSFQLNVENWNNVVQVAVGEGFTVGLHKNGEILYAGSSAHFEITQLFEWTDVVYIAASNSHVLGLTYDGDVLAIGDNAYGQTRTDQLKNMGLISAGGEHTIGISFDGAVLGTGRNIDNRLDFPSVEPLPYIAIDEDNEGKSIYFEEGSTGSLATGVQVGEERKLNLVFSPLNATDRKSENIRFASANSNIAQVDDRGIIIGVSAGETAITATISIDSEEVCSTTITVYVYDINEIENIEIFSSPTKKVYCYGEKLDLLGGKIKIKLSGDRSFIKKIIPSMIEDFYSITTEIGDEVQAYVTEGDQSTDFRIKVINVVKSIEFSNVEELQKVYYYGEEIDLSGAWIKATLTDGTEIGEQWRATELLEQDFLEVFGDTELLGLTTIVLKYTDKLADEKGFYNVFYLSYEIEVIDNIEEIEVALNKTKFNYGEDIFGRGTLIVRMKSGIELEEPIIQHEDIVEGIDPIINIHGYNKYALGSQTVRFEYLNPAFNTQGVMSEELSIEVKDQIESFEVVSMMFENYAVYDTKQDLDRSIRLRVKFEGGAEIIIGKTDDGELFEHIKMHFGEPTQTLGYGYVKLEIRVQTVISENSFETKLTRPSFNIFGISEINSMELTGGEEFLYGQSTDIQLLIYTDNKEEYTIDIDDSILGIDNTLLIPQTIAFTLFDKEATKTICFIDYITEIHTVTDMITIIINTVEENIPLEVYKIMASGTQEAITEWWISDYSNLEIGTHQVNINYKDDKNNLFDCSITLKIIDEVEKVIVKVEPRTEYEYNDDIDLRNFSIELTFHSNQRNIVYYVGNESDFQVIGYDKTSIGVQDVTIIYTVTGDEFLYQFTVRNKISHIKVDDTYLSKNEDNIYINVVGEDLPIRLICVYINGLEEVIEDGFYFYYEKNSLGEKHVRITYGTMYSTAIIVITIDVPARIEIKPPSKKYYEYGETLDLSGGTVTLITKTGQQRIESLDTYRSSLLDFNATPQEKGKQVIKLIIPEYDLLAEFNIYMKEKSSSNFISLEDGVEGIMIDRYNTRIILENSTTLLEFNEMVTSYLDICYKSAEHGYLPVDNRLINTNIAIEIRNRDGILIEKFRVYVKGDANRDGKFDESDIPLLAQDLLQGASMSNIYADINGDGEYTLNDFIMWIKRLETIQGQ